MFWPLAAAGNLFKVYLLFARSLIKSFNVQKSSYYSELLTVDIVVNTRDKMENNNIQNQEDA